MHRAVLTLRLSGADEARTVDAALGPDNAGLLRVRREGAVLTLEAEATTPMGLLRTLDDALACIRATGVA